MKGVVRGVVWEGPLSGLVVVMEIGAGVKLAFTPGNVR